MQCSGEDRVSGQSVAVGAEMETGIRGWCNLQRFPSDLLLYARPYLLMASTGKRVQNLSLWGTLQVQTLALSQCVNLRV